MQCRNCDVVAGDADAVRLLTSVVCGAVIVAQTGDCTHCDPFMFVGMPVRCHLQAMCCLSYSALLWCKLHCCDVNMLFGDFECRGGLVCWSRLVWGASRRLTAL